MFKLPIEGLHTFRKMNIVTLFDEKGQYDLMKCSECSIEGKCRDLRTVEILRQSKKANYCNMSNKDIKEEKFEEKTMDAIKTETNCPDCNKKLYEIAVYIEEETEDYFAEVICKCGHKDMINVTKREKPNPLI